MQVVPKFKFNYKSLGVANKSMPPTDNTNIDWDSTVVCLERVFSVLFTT